MNHPDYWVFMAVVDRAGVDARGKLLFERAPDGGELVFDDEVVERVRIGGQVQSQTVRRRQRHVDDELPVVAQHYRAFIADGRRGAMKERLVPSTWLEHGRSGALIVDPTCRERD